MTGNKPSGNGQKIYVIASILIVSLIAGGIAAFLLFPNKEKEHTNSDPIAVWVEENIKYSSFPESLEAGKEYKTVIELPILDVEVIGNTISNLEKQNDALQGELADMHEQTKEAFDQTTATANQAKELVIQASEEFQKLKQYSSEVNEPLDSLKPVVKKYFQIVKNSQKVYENQNDLLLEKLDELIAFYEGMNDPQQNSDIASTIDEHHNLFYTNYKTLSQYHQSVINKMFSFENVYNKTREDGQTQQIEDQSMDDFYIKLQDYIYEKIITNKQEISIDVSLKQKLNTLVNSINQSKEQIVEIANKKKQAHQNKETITKLNSYLEEIVSLSEKQNLLVEKVEITSPNCSSQNSIKEGVFLSDNIMTSKLNLIFTLEEINPEQKFLTGIITVKLGENENILPVYFKKEVVFQ